MLTLLTMVLKIPSVRGSTVYEINQGVAVCALNMVHYMEEQRKGEIKRSFFEL